MGRTKRSLQPGGARLLACERLSRKRTAVLTGRIFSQSVIKKKNRKKKRELTVNPGRRHHPDGEMIEIGRKKGENGCVIPSPGSGRKEKGD